MEEGDHKDLPETLDVQDLPVNLFTLLLLLAT
jgi:hypothetical protein